MARKDDNDNNNKNCFGAKIVSKEKGVDCKPFFRFTQKDPKTEKYVEKSRGNCLTGDLVKVSVVDAEYDGKPYKQVKFVVVDDEEDELYWWDFTLTYLTRNMLNSLFSVEENFQNLKFKIYQSKSKTDKTKVFTNLSVQQGGENVSWKFQQEDLPKVKKVKVGKTVVTDTEEIDEFFLAELDKFADAVEAAAKTRVKKAPKKKEANASDEDDEHDEGGELNEQDYPDFKFEANGQSPADDEDEDDIPNF